MTRSRVQIEDDVRIVRAPAVVPRESGVPCESAAGTGVHPVRRIARVVGGWALLAIGGALLVLPGPGLLVIAGGLALLATEYDWAARLLRKAKERIQAFRPRGAGDPRTDDAEPREPTCGR